MSKSKTPNEAPHTPEVPRTTENVQTELSNLRDHLEKGQFDSLVDAIMGKAIEGDEVPEATFDAFVSSLTAQEMIDLQGFLEGKTDPRVIELREKLESVQGGLSETTKAVSDGLSATTQKVVTAVDAGIARITSGGMLNDVAAKFGIKEVGSKQLEFVRNSFLAFAAKLIEGVVTSLRKFNPSMDISSMLTAPLELRLMNIKDPQQKELYKAFYLKRAQETTGEFVAPTLAEALKPKTAAAPETHAATGEKVETAKRTVKNADGTTLFEISRTDNKTVVTADGKIAEVKIANSETIDVMALDATPTDKAGLIFKLKDTNKLIAIDGQALRDAVAEKKENFTTTDGITIQLLPQNA